MFCVGDGEDFDQLMESELRTNGASLVASPTQPFESSFLPEKYVEGSIPVFSGTASNLLPSLMSPLAGAQYEHPPLLQLDQQLQLEALERRQQHQQLQHDQQLQHQHQQLLLQQQLQQQQTVAAQQQQQYLAQSQAQARYEAQLQLDHAHMASIVGQQPLSGMGNCESLLASSSSCRSVSDYSRLEDSIPPPESHMPFQPTSMHHVPPVDNIAIPQLPTLAPQQQQQQQPMHLPSHTFSPPG